jgi:Holliday junction resolvase RusA-like endonuclease
VDINFKEPPQFGELQIQIDLGAVSVQSKAEAKKLLVAAIRNETRSLEYILTGDVSVDIEWLVHERTRYESDTSPDVDNVVKPMLDAFAGPDGLIIDDCQIQSVTVSWIDWAYSEQQLRINFRYSPDEWTRRAGLRFVQFGGALCLPIAEGLTDDMLSTVLDHYERTLVMAQEFEVLSGDYYLSRIVLPVQRLFHRTRIHGFHVVSLSDARAALCPAQTVGMGHITKTE